jgi:hypothetical protein
VTVSSSLSAPYLAEKSWNSEFDDICFLEKDARAMSFALPVNRCGEGCMRVDELFSFLCKGRDRVERVARSFSSSFEPEDAEECGAMTAHNSEG